MNNSTDNSTETKRRPRLYVGLMEGNEEVFRSDTTPTEASHGAQFRAVIGPFRTRRGADFMARNGYGNPHCQCVADAERLARRAHYKVD